MRSVGGGMMMVILMTATACGDAQHTSRPSTTPGGGGGGSTTTGATRTTVTGCISVDQRAGGYLLRASDRDARGAEGTTGTGEKSPGSEFRTTGRGGDAIANSPTIGSHAVAGQLFVVVPETGTGDIAQYVGKSVTIRGAILGNVLRSTAVESAAGDCSAPPPSR